MKKLIIIRGLPGSGKSFLARSLSKDNQAIICSADHFWFANGEYKFDINRLKYAHEFCFKMAQSLMIQGLNAIIDNTNTRKKEYQKYLDIADEYGYNVEYHIANFDNKAYDVNTKKWNVDFLYSNNVHGVPLETIKIMAKRFQW